MKFLKGNTAIFLSVIIAGIMISASILYVGGVFKSKSKSRPNDVKEPVGVVQKEAEGQMEKQVNLAKEMSLDEKEFESCLNKKDDSEIKKDLADARAYTATGTPTFFIGLSSDTGEIEAQKIVGAQPFSVFEAVIEAFLEGKKGKSISLITGQGDAEVKLVKVSVDDDPVKGNPEAAVTIIDFSDYECPFCKKYFTSTWPSIKEKYIDTGKVKIVLRDLPLPVHDPVATNEAIAANCAREQGGDDAYFEYHDLLYKNTRSNGKGL